MFTYEVAYRLNTELKCKPRIRAPEIESHADACGAIRAPIPTHFIGGRIPFLWTEENYQKLKTKIII